jgi:hypothetical protein
MGNGAFDYKSPSNGILPIRRKVFNPANKTPLSIVANNNAPQLLQQGETIPSSFNNSFAIWDNQAGCWYFFNDTKVIQRTTNLSAFTYETNPLPGVTFVTGGKWYTNWNDTGVIIAAANSDKLIRRDYYGNWTVITLPISANWKSMVRVNGFWLLCAWGTNILLRSADGLTWTQITLPATGNWQDLCGPASTPSNLMMLDYNTNNVLASTDTGATWTAKTLPAGNYISLICAHSDYRYIALDKTKTTLKTSTGASNGSAWADYNGINVGFNPVKLVANPIGGYYWSVIYAAYGGIPGYTCIWAFNGSTTFTAYQTPNPQDLTNTLFFSADSTFIGISTNANLCRKYVINAEDIAIDSISLLGITGWQSLQVVNGIYFIVAADGVILYSSDGATWQSTIFIVTSGFYPMAIGYINGLYCLHGRYAKGDTTTATTKFYTSPDLLTWTQRTYPNTIATIINRIYTLNGIMYIWSSTLTSYRTTDGTTLTSATIFNKMFIAKGLVYDCGAVYVFKSDGIQYVNSALFNQGSGATTTRAAYGNVFGKDVFIQISGSSTAYNTYYLVYPGLTASLQQQRTLPATLIWTDIIFLGGYFIVFAPTAYAVSKDGINWELVYYTIPVGTNYLDVQTNGTSFCLMFTDKSNAITQNNNLEEIVYERSY